MFWKYYSTNVRKGQEKVDKYKKINNLRRIHQKQKLEFVKYDGLKYARYSFEAESIVNITKNSLLFLCFVANF
jgi:hypothetical protein